MRIAAAQDFWEGDETRRWKGVSARRTDQEQAGSWCPAAACKSSPPCMQPPCGLHAASMQALTGYVSAYVSSVFRSLMTDSRLRGGKLERTMSSSLGCRGVGGEGKRGNRIVSDGARHCVLLRSARICGAAAEVVQSSIRSSQLDWRRRNRVPMVSTVSAETGTTARVAAALCAAQRQPVLQAYRPAAAQPIRLRPYLTRTLSLGMLTTNIPSPAAQQTRSKSPQAIDVLALRHSTAASSTLLSSRSILSSLSTAVI